MHMYISLQEPVFFCKRVSHFCKRAFFEILKSKLSVKLTIQNDGCTISRNLSFSIEFFDLVEERGEAFTVENVIYQRTIALTLRTRSRWIVYSVYSGNCHIPKNYCADFENTF